MEQRPTPWSFSAMGFGVSGILGAKLAAPDRPCLAVIGDGGFTLTPHVLATAVEYDIPAVWLVWNNFSWAAIRDIQYGMFGGREIGTGFYAGEKREPYSPDFAAMARSYGVEGITVKHSDQHGDALGHALVLGKLCLLDVHVDDKVNQRWTRFFSYSRKEFLYCRHSRGAYFSVASGRQPYG
jgi:acetolactate synthase-1/2/3 large subunit